MDIKPRLALLFGIDPRTLAVFRMGLGAILLVDLLIRATDLEAHYTDAGMAPSAAIADRFAGTWRWSVHLIDGSVSFQALLFSFAVLAAVCLAVGFYTRLATCLCWLLLVSLHTRNPLVLNGGDQLLRMLLFWSMFLPTGRMWSVDSRRLGGHAAGTVFSPATAAILLQVCLVYWMTGYYKLQGAWPADDLLVGILYFDSYARPLAHIVREYPQLLRPLGLAVVWAELLGPLLLFSPVLTRRLRLLVIAWFGIVHLGIELTLTVGIFSYASWLAWTLFLPDSFWNALRRGARLSSRPTEPLATHSRPRSAGSRWATGLTGVAVGLLFIYVLLGNLATIRGGWLPDRMPAWWSRLAELTLVGQKWDMFYEVPSRDGWYILVGRLKDGRVVDLLRGGRAADWKSYEKPIYIYRSSPNHRWRKLYRRLLDDREAHFRELLCRYLARRWDDTHPYSACVVDLELHYMQELGAVDDEHDRFQQLFLYSCVLQPEADVDDSL